MNEELIIGAAKVIQEWNPLGEKANSVEQLDGYRYEAIDIIASINIAHGEELIKESIEQVLTQAFNIELSQVKLAEAANKIKSLISE
jgi:hypothetical protein